MITPVQPLFANYESDDLGRIDRQIVELDQKLSSANLSGPDRTAAKKHRDSLAAERPNVKSMIVKSLPIQAIAQINNQFTMLVLWDNKIIPAHAVGVPETGLALRSIDTLDLVQATRPRKPEPTTVTRTIVPAVEAPEPVVEEAPKPKKALLAKKEVPKAED